MKKIIEKEINKIWAYYEDKINNCEQCVYNEGYEDSNNIGLGPCGQQNCWHRVARQEEEKAVYEGLI